MPSKESTRVPRPMAARVMALVAVSVAAAAAAMLMAARPPFGPADMPPVAQPKNVSAEPTATAQPQVATVESTATKPPMAQAQRKAAAASNAPAARALPAEMPTEEAIDTKLFLVESASKGPVEELEAKGSVVESASKARRLEPAVVTITGCLERDDETFRLKDTSGEDTPKSRSWKSGFLKKRAASIEVVDTADSVQLPDHVGQRVSITGVLVDREMEARSVLRVAEFCDQ